MPLIEVWNSVRVRADMESLQRSMLKSEFRKACLGIHELGLTNPEQVTVRFPDLADEPEPEHAIMVVVELLFDKPERTLEVRQKLAAALGTAVCGSFIGKGRKVEVAVKRFNPDRDAFFSTE